MIVKDKSTLDIRFAREILKAWMMNDLGMRSFEFQYSQIPKRIIAEKFISSLDSDYITDYKIHCFNGEPKFMQFAILKGRQNYMTLLDFDWNLMPFQRTDFNRILQDEIPSKPKNLELMIELARELSKDFSFVRVDFYNLNGKIFIGELTFSPSAGFFKYDPPEWNLKLGELLKLPPKSKSFNPFKN